MNQEELESIGESLKESVKEVARLRAQVAELEAKLEAEDRLNQIIAGHRDDYRKELKYVRQGLQDIHDGNTGGLEPALYAYVILNP